MWLDHIVGVMIPSWLLLAGATGQLTAHVPSVFTSQECKAIVDLFGTMEASTDVRENPLLPDMEGSAFRVARVNRYDDGSLNLRDVVHNKLVDTLRALATEAESFARYFPDGILDSVDAFTDLVEFTLLHEFNPELSSFDWHTDTKGDQTMRTLNVNIMLSSPDEYSGGELQVGDAAITPQQGDLYLYPAATPHKVNAVETGRRYTLVMALSERRLKLSEDVIEERRRMRLDNVEAVFDRLATCGGEADLLGAESSASLCTSCAPHDAARPTCCEPKVHILHGEHLEALGGRGDDAQRAFCRSYRATADPDAPARLAANFYAAGVDALALEQLNEPSAETDEARAGPDLPVAEKYLAMAACVDPKHAEAAQALAVVKQALEMRRDAERQS